jgi:signal transduction histidine kinase
LNRLLEKDLAETNAGGHQVNPVVLMVKLRKESAALAASAGWDGGKPEVERYMEMVFPGLALAIKFRGTTVEALSQRFLQMNLWIVICLSLLLGSGIFLTFWNVNREMRLAKLKSDFVANVSHELRTPLALIRLYSETLEMGRLNTAEKYQEYYRIIRKESERLTALINNILDFARIEAGRKEYEFRETNVAELVRSTLDSYRYQIEQQGFQYEETIEDDLPVIRLDREAIARSLVNLVNNALKYSEKEKFIGVHLYRTNGYVRLEVEDHGIGIPRSEQQRIFENFYRVGDPLVHNTKGSGLGLALVRHIVQAHGGHVEVQSVPGKGSKFVILLPVEQPSSAAGIAA